MISLGSVVPTVLLCKKKNGDLFKRPPVIAYNKQQNLQGHQIRDKIPRAPRIHPKIKILGMKKCGNDCTACPYILEGKSIKVNGLDWKINKDHQRMMVDPMLMIVLDL